jgi:tetraacyldisaccharide 4'-kinase
MVRSSDTLSARGYLTAEFPPDRAVSPAWLTIPASRLYELAVKFRNNRYDNGRVFRPPIPVISVGNLTVGGTGKTPFVMELARYLQDTMPALARPNAIAILSRGYGRLSSLLSVVETESHWQNCGDEPLLIKRAVPTAAVIVHADRSLAAKYAMKEFDSRLLILDDGFQHRRLARDVDMILMDAAQPLGNGYCLPAGPLREAKEAIFRAWGIVAVGEGLQAAEIGKIFEKPVLCVKTSLQIPADWTRNRPLKVYVLTSIARPQRFTKSLNENGLEIMGSTAFRDHHRFSTHDLARVGRSAAESHAELVVTTAKDRIRISDWDCPIPLYAVEQKMQIENELILQKMLEPAIRQLAKLSEQ